MRVHCVSTFCVFISKRAFKITVTGKENRFLFDRCTSYQNKTKTLRVVVSRCPLGTVFYYYRPLFKSLFWDARVSVKHEYRIYTRNRNLHKTRRRRIIYIECPLPNKLQSQPRTRDAFRQRTIIITPLIIMQVNTIIQ